MNVLKSSSAAGIALALFFNFFANDAFAQAKKNKEKAQKEFDPAIFPPLKFSEIPGAPVLTTPQLVMGKTTPVKGEGMGWASPAYYDVNGDGKKDLLIGEFGSGIEHRGLSYGNFVRVYKNIGTNEAPQFDDHFTYLYPTDKLHMNGSPLSIHTWCCLGFTPRFVDLDHDGIDDLVTGQYDPGFVTWFKGTENGFLPGQKLPQFGDTMMGNKRGDSKKPWTDPDNWAYWSYSAVAFGDMTGDGLQDMIVGGNTLRISKNIGTKTQPGFGRRELLLDLEGKPLLVASGADTSYRGHWGDPNYGYSIIPYVVDWNNDGTPDILATNLYGYKGSVALTYFQGEKTKDGIRFHPGVSLFETLDGSKAFPGGYMHLYVTDWNNDGIKDVVLGTSIPFRAEKPNEELTWAWEGEKYSMALNPAYYSEQMKEEIKGYFERVEDQPEQRQTLVYKFYGHEDYTDLFHQGYVYVLLGTNPAK